MPRENRIVHVVSLEHEQKPGITGRSADPEEMRAAHHSRE